MGTAIFDLDRTVTRRGTWTRFVLFAGGWHPGFLMRLPLWLWHGVAGVAGLTDGLAYKRYSLRLLSVMSAPELKARAEAFVAREVANGLRPGAVDAIRYHLARGDRMILATACVDLLALPFGQALGFHDVVSTPLVPAEASGRFVPTMSGPNCDGPEKLRRVEALHLARPFVVPVLAYSDHVSDLHLLEWADRGFAVNPSRGLRRAAQRSAVRVVDFDMPLESLDALP